MISPERQLVRDVLASHPTEVTQAEVQAAIFDLETRLGLKVHLLPTEFPVSVKEKAFRIFSGAREGKLPPYDEMSFAEVAQNLVG